MNLEFDADEQQTIEVAREVFRHASPLPAWRDSGPVTSWEKLTETGWNTLGSAVEGGDLHVSFAAGIAREAGAALIGEQLVTSSYLLSSLVEQVPEPGATFVRERLAARPGLLLGDGRRSSIVASAGDTNFCFGAEQAADLYRVRRTDGSYTLDVLDGADVRSSSPIALSIAQVSGEPQIVASYRLECSESDIARIERWARLLQSAALIGCANTLLLFARDYVAERKQFDVVVGSFQAVKHLLADVFTDIEIAWSAILVAVADDADDEHRCAVARFNALNAAMTAARNCTQAFGGIGYTWEFDAHWYVKALLEGAQRFGSVDEIALDAGKALMEAARADA